MTLRKVGSNATPYVTLTKVGDEYRLITESSFKTSEVRFKLDEEKTQTTFDGLRVPTTFTLDGNTLIQTEKRPTGKSIITREFSAKELNVKAQFGEVVSTRLYTPTNWH